jgi:hypothetical protein
MKLLDDALSKTVATREEIDVINQESEDIVWN